MSDLISTPSQTQSPVSNEAFEALIDLLAFDGTDENLGDRTRPQANISLRDPSGKLDFNKIRQIFTTQNGVVAVPGSHKHRVQSPPVPHEDGDSDDDRHSQRTTSPAVPSRFQSPKPVERPPAGHRRSSTFGNQHWAAIHENAAKVEDTAHALSRQPLSFDELNTALAGAQEEVKSLRRQYDELQALVSKRSGAEIRNQVKPSSPAALNTDKDKAKADVPGVGPQTQSESIISPVLAPFDMPTEIASLSETDAKRVLSSLVRSLNLSLSDLTTPSALSPQQSLLPPNPARQYDVASISRALRFLGTVDELVWRRSSAPSGPRTLLPVCSEENIVALTARLELWERAVRRSSRI